MSAPVRLQLNRRKGFNLQALSLATNGLPAVNVARPSKWGNPYKVGECAWTHLRYPDDPAVPETVRGLAIKSRRVVADALDACFLYWFRIAQALLHEPSRSMLARSFLELRGLNCACWCPIDQPCHADILLYYANPGPMQGHLDRDDPRKSDPPYSFEWLRKRGLIDLPRCDPVTP